MRSKQSRLGVKYLFSQFKFHFLHDGYDYLRLCQIVSFSSVLLCCSIRRLFLKAAVYVLMLWYWLFLLFSSSFSSWFSLLNFNDKFWVWFPGICSPYLSWRCLHAFRLVSYWIVTSWFLLTCIFTSLYSVKGKFD